MTSNIRTRGRGGEPRPSLGVTPADSAGVTITGGDARDGDSSFVFTATVRRCVSIAAIAAGVAIVAASGFVPDGADWYLTALVLAAAPFATAGLFFARRTIAQGPPTYRPFWRRWFAAALTAYASGAAALVGVVTGASAALALAALLLVGAVPLWCAAALGMLRAQAGRRTVSVDVLGALTALVVLGTPAILLVAEPLAGADHPVFVAPFVASIVFVPAGLYLSLHGLSLVPPGQRATQGIAMALGAAFAVNASVQIAQILSDFSLPLPLLVGFQVLNMGLLMAVPLWAHRHAISVLDGLLPEQQVRRVDPLTPASLVVLPAVVVFAWVGRDEHPWRIAVVLGALLCVVVLGALRQAMLLRETRRLYAEVERVAEERRHLLTSMVRALEDDRRRVAAELHVQAVESFAAMGALVQTAYATLPPDTALTVKGAIAQLQDDLSARADALARLTAAVRPPTFVADGQRVGPDGDDRSGHGTSAPPVHDGALGTALRASAREVIDERSSTQVVVTVDPDLELDWSTTTIVYRIVQEALVNAARHATASAITVEVGEAAGAVEVRIADDGTGFDPAAVVEGPGIASMRLFAQLGNGTFDIAARPDTGTVVRAVLGGRPAGAAPGTGLPDRSRRRAVDGTPRHLLLVATGTTDASDTGGTSSASGPT